MSKLIEIERFFNENVFLVGRKQPTIKHITSMMASENINWLIEQAKRVQELEDIIYKDERQAVLESTYEENKRYRETLGFYSKESNYSGYLTAGGWVKTPINDDNGKTARQALKGELE